jgi:hypothetical protein
MSLKWHDGLDLVRRTTPLLPGPKRRGIWQEISCLLEQSIWLAIGMAIVGSESDKTAAVLVEILIYYYHGATNPSMPFHHHLILSRRD